MEQMLPRPTHGPLVSVVVDDTDACLGKVLLAARDAGHRQQPLELIQPAATGQPTTPQQRAQQLERLDTALDIARRAVPGLEVRIRNENPQPA